MNTLPSFLITILFIALSSGCTLHRIDIQQGNVIDAKAEAQLKPGMTKDQAQFLFGTPLILDPFHHDRWDYVYYLDKPGQPLKERRITLYFQDGKIVRVVKETDLESSL